MLLTPFSHFMLTSLLFPVASLLFPLRLQLIGNPLPTPTNNRNSRYVFSVMDYIGPGGELFDFIKTGKAQAEGEPYVRELMIQLLQGMQYLHDRYVFHRDISCENVLLCPPISSGMLPVGGGAGAARSLAAAGAGPTAVPRVVIIDLGMCLLMPDAGKCVPSGACGKINYCAEEILANKGELFCLKVACRDEILAHARDSIAIVNQFAVRHNQSVFCSSLHCCPPILCSLSSRHCHPVPPPTYLLNSSIRRSRC